MKGTDNSYDYGMRMYDPCIGRFMSVDPITDQYPMLTTYQYASNRPIDGTDKDGLEWKRVESGFQWDPDNAYVRDANGNNTAVLNSGYYKQAVLFVDDGTFHYSNSDGSVNNVNMGSASAYVFEANGSIAKFNSCVYPSTEDYTPIPDGQYEADEGSHKLLPDALRMYDIGTDESEHRIYLPKGTENNMHENQYILDANGDKIWYTERLDIHTNYNSDGTTGIQKKNGKIISENCLLIDQNQWERFIGIFDSKEHKSDIVGVTLSHCGGAPLYKPTSTLAPAGKEVTLPQTENNYWQ